MEVEARRINGHRHRRHSSSSTSNSSTELQHSAAKGVDRGQMNSGEKFWEYFPCPLCDIDIELPFVCKHLEEEHCFNLKNAVCPMCADFPEKDMITHFTVQHSNLLRRTHSPQSSSIWPPTQAAFEKEPDDGRSLFEEAMRCRLTPTLDPAPDPLLSQFVCNFTAVNTESREVSLGGDTTHAPPHEARFGRSSSGKPVEQDLKERLQRMEFLSEILFSTIF